MKSNNESKKIKPVADIQSTETKIEKSINFSEFCEDIKNFCSATVERMGTLANDHLQKIVISLLGISKSVPLRANS